MSDPKRLKGPSEPLPTQPQQQPQQGQQTQVQQQQGQQRPQPTPPLSRQDSKPVPTQKAPDFIAAFFCTKHSWRGKYKRIFGVRTTGVTTLNPTTLEITNNWEYGAEVSDIQAVPKSGNEFKLMLKKGRKSETLTFSTEHRPYLLTEVQKLLIRSSVIKKETKNYQASKINRLDDRINVLLSVGNLSLDQVDVLSQRILATYEYKDIQGISSLSDHPEAVIIYHGVDERMHLFYVNNREDLTRSILTSAQAKLGITVPVGRVGTQTRPPISLEQFKSLRLGTRTSNEEHLLSISEFRVSKQAKRHLDPVSRILCITETYLVERDPATYTIVTARPFSDIYSIVRYPDDIDAQLFAIEYLSGPIRKYTSPERDVLLASLLDSAMASGNINCHVTPLETMRGLRMDPLNSLPEQEVEHMYLKAIAGQAESGLAMKRDLEYMTIRFNINIPHSGLRYGKGLERVVVAAITYVLSNGENIVHLSTSTAISVLQTLRRLFASRAGFEAFSIPSISDKLLTMCWKLMSKHDFATNYAIYDLFSVLLQHDSTDLSIEQQNKNILLNNLEPWRRIVNELKDYLIKGTGGLVVLAIIDLLKYLLCDPYSTTTPTGCFNRLLEFVTDLGRTFFRLFHYKCTAVVKGACMLMKAIIEESPAEVSHSMQRASLLEGALLTHLYKAIFLKATDKRQLIQRELSKRLINLWSLGNVLCTETLKNIFPPGLLFFLSSNENPPEQEDLTENRRADNVKEMKVNLSSWTTLVEHWKTLQDSKLRAQNSTSRTVIYRQRKVYEAPSQNWPLFFYKIHQDHSNAALIWNHHTREELRESLESEMRLFSQEQSLIGNKEVVSWNYVEFTVKYPSLSKELRVGDYYLRLLLEETGDIPNLHQPDKFFDELYHRFLLERTVEMKTLCLKAMAIVYGNYGPTIGPFIDTPHILNLLRNCYEPAIRDRLMKFIEKLLLVRENAKQFIDNDGIPLFVELLTLVHLQKERAATPLTANVLTNLITAGPNIIREGEVIWYYSLEEGERNGPVRKDDLSDLYKNGTITETTLCWSQGLESWKPLRDIMSLRWEILAKGPTDLGYTDLGLVCLEVLIRLVSLYPSRDPEGAVIRPVPRAKRMLADPLVLPHIVQVMLTFEPALVDKVAVLLSSVMQDNATAMPKLYLTGVFYFSMMYTGSNILSLARFLEKTHTRQTFLTDENISSELVRRSILGVLLPEAMVCFLGNYGADKFAEIFLGDFDTPEAIWNHEMRRHMIEVIAGHLGDFPVRLQCNPQAIYSYVPIAPISFPELENEMFCNIYYLRHLCDRERFPDWPITNHTDLLRDILSTWRRENLKKAPTMSEEEAYKILELKMEDNPKNDEIRKSYRTLAAKFHPDKNPEGRETFEKVQKAYELLTSSTASRRGGPDPERVDLILRSQSILYGRYKDIMKAYRYSGYPLLITCIQNEIIDEALFSKKPSILTSSTELLHLTMTTSPSNCEEFRKENGIEILEKAFSRCLDVISIHTDPNTTSPIVATYIVKTFSGLAQFPPCRKTIQEHPQIVEDICRCSFFSNCPKLLQSSLECCFHLAVDSGLQDLIFQAGFLWHALLLIFHYDYTLEESGVDADVDTNTQKEANQHAKSAIYALCRLAGYSGDSPEHKPTQGCLNASLTSYITMRMKKEKAEEILRELNSNSETPYLIWNSDTRSELNEFLQTQQQNKIHTGQHQLEALSNFTYSTHRKELKVSGIFIRVYNQQPTFVLAQPNALLKNWLKYISDQTESIKTPSNGGDRDEWELYLTQMGMMLNAIKNLIVANPGVELEIVNENKIAMIFTFLRPREIEEINNLSDENFEQNLEIQLQTISLGLISLITSNSQCVTSISNSDVLSNLLILLKTSPPHYETVMKILNKCSSHSKIIQDLMKYGGVLYLLNLFCNSIDQPNIRSQSAITLAKLSSEKTQGQTLTILLNRFIPGFFLEIMKENPDATVQMFDGEHENPELIWNQATREKLSNTIIQMSDEYFNIQWENPRAPWVLPKDFKGIEYAEISGELCIGGVYIRLFLKQPQWTPRSPKDFLFSLLETYCENIAKTHFDEEVLHQISDSICCLLETQNALSDHIPATGYIKKLVDLLEGQHLVIQECNMNILREFSMNSSCVEMFGRMSSIRSILRVIEPIPPFTSIAVEMLDNLFSKNNCSRGCLVAQSMYDSCPIVTFLLDVIGEKNEQTSDPAATKAHAIRALKAMVVDFEHGNGIAAKLEGNPIWDQCRDQNYDLFLARSRNQQALLTGTTASVQLLLTHSVSVSSTSNTQPPQTQDSRPPPVASSQQTAEASRQPRYPQASRPQPQLSIKSETGTPSSSPSSSSSSSTTSSYSSSSSNNSYSGTSTTTYSGTSTTTSSYTGTSTSTAPTTPLYASQAGNAVGNAVANAATNQQYQQQVGSSVSSSANNRNVQQSVGNTIASSSDNPLVQAAAQNSSVQSGVGRAVGVAAQNQQVQQSVGNAIANQAKNPQNQQSAVNYFMGK